MQDLHDLWKKIEEDFDKDESLDPEAYLLEKGVGEPRLPGDILADASAVVQLTFAESGLPENLKLSRYRILEQFETGGQSEIYLAERSDGVYTRTVVIKLLSRANYQHIHKDQLRQEMQLLAELNHPGVVNILDGGLADNQQPWLVLEHVQGKKLDDYCRRHALTVRDRVKLIRELCDALVFIHRRGVVHMDLKPNNVLVRTIDQNAFPVLIDFGIALRAASGPGRESRAMFGTRGYAAPEQLDGKAVDQRSDLYSLGMTLAQLLLADDDEPVGLLSRKEREALLSEKRIRGDLADIVSRCTNEDPEKRYQAAEELRTDLDAWLNDLPLVANRRSPVNVVSKWISRHPWSGLALLAVLLVSAFGGWKYTMDTRALQQATLREKNQGDELYNFVLTDLFERLTRIGRISVLRDVAERSIQHLEGQDPETLDDAAHLQSALAYMNAGRVFDALESGKQALSAYEDARHSLDRIAKVEPFEQPVLLHTARLEVLRSETLATDGQKEQTESALLAALELTDRLDSVAPGTGLEVAWEAHLMLGWHYMDYAEPEKAGEHINTSLEIAEQQVQAAGQDRARWSRHLSHTLQAQTWFEFDYGDSQLALPNLERALALSEAAIELDGQNIDFRHNRRVLLNQKAFLALETGDPAAARAALDEAAAIGEDLKSRAPENREYQRELAYTYTTAGELADNNGDLDASLANYQRGLELSRAIHEADSGGFASANDLAVDLLAVGRALELLGREVEATEYFSEALDVISPVQASEPDNKYYSHTKAVALIKLGEHQRAKPLIDLVVESGFNDESFDTLLIENGLETTTPAD